MKKGIIFSVFFLINSIVFAIPQSDPIKIGALFFMSGEFASLGIGFREGAELAADVLNQKGGINGHPVKLIFEDTQYKPAEIVKSSQKLINFDKVTAAMVTTLHEAKIAGQFFQSGKIPLITLWDSSPELTQIGDYMFGIGAWIPSSGEKAAEYSTQHFKAKKAIVIQSQTEWSVAVANAFIKSFKALNGEIIEVFQMNTGEPDFRSVILKAKRNNPDVLFAPIDDNILTFFKQLKELKFSVPVITSDNLSDQLIATDGKSLEGIYQTQAANPDYPKTKEMLDEYRNKYHHNAGYKLFTAWGYDGVMLIAHAVETASTDSLKVKEVLYQTKDFDGASGLISIDKNGASKKLVSMFQIQNGKFVKLQ